MNKEVQVIVTLKEVTYLCCKDTAAAKANDVGYFCEKLIGNGTLVTDDLISRSALRASIDNLCAIGTPCHFKGTKVCEICFVTDFRNLVDNAPTIGGNNGTEIS